MSDTSSNSSLLPSLLLVAFVVLKLTGHIDWSWWWVLSPIWGTALIVLPIVFIIWRIHKKNERELRGEFNKVFKNKNQ